MPDGWLQDIHRYLSDPGTRVFINYNEQLGKPLYSVEVMNSKEFWLDSFKTKKEAEKYIQKHHLVCVQ